MLFARADIQNCKAITEALSEFRFLSGQKVNLAKSKPFFSPNLSSIKAKELSRLSGVALTSDLGKSLGVPLLHKRLSKKKTYQEILFKVQSKLASWKSHLLNMAGRCTLIQALNVAMPVHIMQKGLIPLQ